MAEASIAAEIAGRVCALNVKVGDKVHAGDELILVEAMKMELPITSPSTGSVTSILVKIDDVIAEGQIIATVAT